MNLRTLAIASLASATAAVVVSQFWASGTPIAAAVTPVVVAIVSELLNRPTEKIVQRLTVETRVLPGREPGRPPTGPPAPPPPPPTGGPPGPQPPPMGVPPGPQPPRATSVYRQPQRGLPWRGIAVTALLAFVIGAVILTVPELIAGESIGKGGGSTSYFGGSDRKDKEPREEQSPAPTQPPTEQPRPTPTTPTTPVTPPPPTTTPTETAPSTQTTPQR